MTIHELAGKPAPAGILEDIPKLVSAYYTNHPDPTQASQRVSFGTSGHRGSSSLNTFNEMHIAAICQSVCEYRSANGVNGPLFLGKDTHAHLGFPPMRVLQFGFSSAEDDFHRPCSYPEHCVAYTGTHDNDTLMGWHDHRRANVLCKHESDLLESELDSSCSSWR